MISLDDGLVAETFGKVQKQIQGICFYFSRKYRLPYDDLYSECSWKYLQIYRSYDPEKSAFTTWLINKLRYHLTEYIRDRMRESRLCPREECYDIPRNPSKFVLGEFLEILSPESQEIIGLCLETPLDVLLSVAELGDATPGRIRQAIREYLMDQGWKASDIRDCFNEIKENLL